MSAVGRTRRFLAELKSDEAGATVIEYALIVFIASIGIGFVLPETGLSFDEIFGAAQAGLDRGVVMGEAD